MKTATVELIGIVLYLVFLQYVLAEFVFDKPEEVWVRILWRWLASSGERYFQSRVAPRYNSPRVVTEPSPLPPKLDDEPA